MKRFLAKYLRERMTRRRRMRVLAVDHEVLATNESTGYATTEVDCEETKRRKTESGSLTSTKAGRGNQAEEQKKRNGESITVPCFAEDA